jgi:hypothetical protein
MGNLTEAKIILPLLSNSGKAFPIATLTDIHTQILSTFGGFTRTKAEGAWRDPKTGQVYSEDVNVYTVSADWEDMIQVGALRLIARASAERMDQICIYIMTPTMGIEFIEPAALAVAA